jgi:hypothetical protein
MWQRAAEERRISQLTPPGDVLDFILSFPGLSDAALQHPSYLLSYAPQLALPGVADWLQETIDETFEWASTSAGIDPASQEGRRLLVSNYGYLSLRDVELVRAAPSRAACTWVQGDLHGPPVRVYEAIDHAGWLASASSAWLGDDMREALLQGIAEWDVWLYSWRDRPPGDFDRLLEILDDKKNPAREDDARPILARQLEKTVQILGLDESGEELTDRLFAAQFLKLCKGGRRRH